MAIITFQMDWKSFFLWHFKRIKAPRTYLKAKKYFYRSFQRFTVNRPIAKTFLISRCRKLLFVGRGHNHFHCLLLSLISSSFIMNIVQQVVNALITCIVSTAHFEKLFFFSFLYCNGTQSILLPSHWRCTCVSVWLGVYLCEQHAK